MLDFVIFAVTFLTVLLIAILWLYPSAKRVTSIPGLDPTSKDDGNLSDMIRAGSVHEFLLETHKEFGSITGFWWGGKYVVSIASPKLFKEHSNVFDKPGELFQLFSGLFSPNSIYFTNGIEARQRRKQYDHVFTHENFNLYNSKFQKIADSIEEKWQKATKTDHIALSEATFAYAVKTSLVSMGNYFDQDKMAHGFKKFFDMCWHELELSMTNSVSPEESKQFKEAIKSMQAELKKAISHQKDKSSKKEKLLIDSIIENCSDEDTAVSDCLVFMCIAFSTTGNLLTWCLYFLASHGDVQEKLHSEIDRVLSKNDSINSSNIGQMRYLTQVLDETLRCAVVFPWTARVQNFDSELGGHKIPKNTPVIQALGVVLQDEQLWPVPNKFDPERFSTEESKDRPSFAFSPFGLSGKRKCPSYKFTYLQCSILIATLIRKFELSLLDNQVVQPVYGVVTKPAEEVWIRLKKRS